MKRKKREHIAAVVVTYNRLPLLKKCIASLKRQTRKLDAIIVVNNNSTDGTGVWLKKQKGLKVITQENLGGAGGFHTGLKTAYELGYDWFWVMDDDVEADRHCLKYFQSLINVRLGGKNNFCVVPLRVWNKENEVSDSGALKYDLTSFYRTSNPRTMFDESIKRPEQLKGKFFPLEDFSFEGPLIPRNAVKTIGLPHREFFIFCDDGDFSLRLRKAGFELLLMGSSIIYRNGEKGPIPPNSWKRAFLIRNTSWLSRIHGRTFLFRYFRPILVNLRLLLASVLKGHYFKNPKLLSRDGKAMLEGYFGNLPMSGFRKVIQKESRI